MQRKVKRFFFPRFPRPCKNALSWRRWAERQQPPTFTLETVVAFFAAISNIQVASLSPSLGRPTAVCGGLRPLFRSVTTTDVQLPPCFHREGPSFPSDNPVRSLFLTSAEKKPGCWHSPDDARTAKMQQAGPKRDLAFRLAFAALAILLLLAASGVESRYKQCRVWCYRVQKP